MSFNLDTVIDNAPDIYALALKKFAALGYVPADASIDARSDMIQRFQLDYGVIADASDPGAGSYGPKTTLALASAYSEWVRKNTPDLSDPLLIQKHDAYEAGVETKESAELLAQNMRTVRLGSSADSIKNLQKFLQKVGNYDGSIDGIMSLEVLGGLRKYQYNL